VENMSSCVWPFLESRVQGIAVFAPWQYGRFHYPPSRWRRCGSNSRDHATVQTPTNPPNFAWG
jgi:hypothetical protein